jgi:hypothetical protein
LESKHFARAPKKTRFLEFVSEQAFLGNGDSLNEYLIGVEVYGRGSGFNAQEDPIVRVQAHEIRRSLKQYYKEDGKDSLIRIDLPAGHYVPIFDRNAAEETTETEILDAAALRAHIGFGSNLLAACIFSRCAWTTEPPSRAAGYGLAR